MGQRKSKQKTRENSIGIIFQKLSVRDGKN